MHNDDHNASLLACPTCTFWFCACSSRDCAFGGTRAFGSPAPTRAWPRGCLDNGRLALSAVGIAEVVVGCCCLEAQFSIPFNTFAAECGCGHDHPGDWRVQAAALSIEIDMVLFENPDAMLHVACRVRLMLMRHGTWIMRRSCDA